MGYISHASSSDTSLPSSDSATEERIRRLVAEFERSLRESFPRENEPKTLEQTEQLTDEIGEAIKEKIQRDVIEQQSQCREFARRRIRCAFCHRANAACHHGKRARQIITLHGSVSLLRSYYHCTDCGKGFCPLDRQLGIGSGQLSISVVSLLCRFASYFELSGGSTGA